jgi:ATP-binding cassette subfamily B protein
MPESLDTSLEQSPFFRLFPAEELTDLKQSCEPLERSFGQLIVQEGDPADALFMILEGQVRVLKRSDSGEELALDKLGPGDVFGESALFEGGIRNASVRCSSPTRLLRLSREKFDALAEKRPSLRKHLEQTRKLRAIRIFLFKRTQFGRLPDTELSQLIEKLQPVSFADGQYLIEQGDNPGPMFLIESGKVHVFHVNPDGDQRNLAYLHEGDFLGELSVLNGAPRVASAVAQGPVKCLSLSPDSVQSLYESCDHFRRLLDERRAQYDLDREARVPLDFAQEQVATDANEGSTNVEGAEDVKEDAPFADESGYFRKRGRIRKFSFIAQIGEMDCGAACLGMVCRHFGRAVNMTKIRELCSTATDGTSLRGIVHAAKELGLAARSVKASRANLDSMPLPAIVHWEGRHWVTLYDVGRKDVRLMDPAIGFQRLSRKEFLESWTGYAALFDFTEAFKDAPESKSGLSFIWPVLMRNRGSLLLAGALAMIAGILQIAFPVFSQVIVDRVIVDVDLDLLDVIMVGLGSSLAFLLACNIIHQFLLAFTAVRIDLTMTDLITRRMLELPISFFQRWRVGDIQRRLESAQQIRQFYVNEGLAGALAILQLVAAVALMLVYSIPMTGVFAATLPLFALLMLASRKILKPLLNDIEARQAEFSSVQIDAIRGIEAVKASAAEASFRNQLLGNFLSISQKTFRSTFATMTYDSLVNLVSLIGASLFLYFGARTVIAGNMTIGAFVAFNSLILLSFNSMVRALTLWDEFQFVAILQSRLQEIFESEPEQGWDRSQLKPVPSLEGRLGLRNVSFRYGGPESPLILNNINLEIAPGETIALVGRSGSGKTTLIKLLAGLIEPNSGDILYDHCALPTLSYRDLRRCIGMVLQENHVFDTTIAQNIAFGDPEPDDERIQRSARLANADGFIENFPLGYETRIGVSGIGLSGGQRQRIAIARALYNDPPVLIFDEATSALDTESEKAIQDNLAALMGGRTSIVIAHRLSTIRDADRIVVLEKGQIAEIGNHEELMAARGLYFFLSSQQLGVD